jgi:magnesium chelatase family protein
MTKTFTNLGLEGYEILVEADANKSLPGIEIIWLPDAAIKESKERLRATFRNVGIILPNKRFVLNLSPSDIRKVGTSFDLSMAVAILVLLQEWRVHHQKDLEKYLFFGELGLDGTIKRVNWLLPSVISAIKKWYKDFFVPSENLYELEYISWITIYPLDNFLQLVWYFVDWKDLQCVSQSKDLWKVKNKNSVLVSMLQRIIETYTQ